MKNYEKYADEIKGYDGFNFCTDFIVPHVLKSDDCSNNCSRCKMLQTIWLLGEYEEPKIDWSKIKIDTPILVRNDESDKWFKRYFAKYEGGKIYAWKAGRTSWTEDCIVEWNYAKLSEDGEERKELEVDWSKVNVDTPILVGEGDGEWVKRYFAEYKDGIVYAWCGGSTSWDANNMMMSWKYAKLAESEE